MKIRTGFVSNSSSTSYVIVGFKKEGLDAVTLATIVSKEDFSKDKDQNRAYDYLYKNEWFFGHDTSVVGKIVSTSDGEEGLEPVDSNKIAMFERQVKNAFPDEKVQLWVGVVQS